MTLKESSVVTNTTDDPVEALRSVFWSDEVEAPNDPVEMHRRLTAEGWTLTRTGMTITEAAASLGLSPRTVRQAVSHGVLPARRVGPIWTVTPAAVEWYRAERKGKRGRPRREGR